MELGVSIPHMGPLASPTFVPEFSRRAEEAGFDGLWAAEHLAVPQEMQSAYTLTRRPVVVASEGVRETMGLNLEMITTLAVAAAVTSRVRIGSSVTVLPLRNPLVNARQLASIDLYSGGRLVIGAGVGWLKEEAEALGMPWDRRGARTEEHIALLRTVWGATGENVRFDGEFYSFPDIDPDPRPGRMIPILIGGHSDIALDRAARIGDGWIAAGMSPDRVRAALDELRAACERHGRDFGEMQVFVSSNASMDMDGGLDAVQEQIASYEELGVDHLRVNITTASESAALEDLAAWGEEVLAH